MYVCMYVKLRMYVCISIATGSSQPAYPCQMGNCFSGSCGSPGQVGLIIFSNKAVKNNTV